MIPSFSAAWKLFIPADQGFVLPVGDLAGTPNACAAVNAAAFGSGGPNCVVSVDTG